MLSLNPAARCDARYSDVGYDTIRVDGEALADLLRGPAYGAVKWQRGGAIQGRMHLFGRSTTCPTFMVSMIGVPKMLHTVEVTIVIGGSNPLNAACARLAALVLTWIEDGDEAHGWLCGVIKKLSPAHDSEDAIRVGDRQYTATYRHLLSMGGSLTVTIEPVVG